MLGCSVWRRHRVLDLVCVCGLGFRVQGHGCQAFCREFGAKRYLLGEGFIIFGV